MSIWNVLKSDLAEFVSTVKVDAVETVATVAKTVKSERRAEEPLIEPKTSSAYAPPRTWFTDDVEDPSFSTFCSKFDVGLKTADIAQRLTESPPLTTLHAELVPTHVSYKAFWERFYFQASKHAKPSLKLEDENSDEELGWDAEDGEDGDSLTVVARTSPEALPVASDAPAAALQPTEPPSAAAAATAVQLVALKEKNEHLEALLETAQASMASEVAAFKAQNEELASQLAAAQATVSRYETTDAELRREVARLGASAEPPTSDDSAQEAALALSKSEASRAAEQVAAEAVARDKALLEELPAAIQPSISATVNVPVEAAPEASPSAGESSAEEAVEAAPALATKGGDGSDTEWGDDWG